MLRRIIDHSKLTPEVIELLNQKFPEGIDEDEIFSVENSKGERLRVVEVRSQDTIYLIKVSSKVESAMSNFDEDNEEDKLDIDLDEEELENSEKGNEDDED